MARIRSLFALTAVAALSLLAACDDSSSTCSDCQSTTGGDVVGTWMDVTLDDEGGFLSYDSTILDIKADGSGSSYSLWWEGPAGVMRDTTESRRTFTWITRNDSLLSMPVTCEHKINGQWQPNGNCEVGEVDGGPYKVGRDHLIFLSDGGDEIDEDTLFRVR